ncbi:MAG: AAA family ATPase [Elusimicrobia bacterium]|nr:AAA family ATPase [Elusimicrobiota bacterium]
MKFCDILWLILTNNGQFDRIKTVIKKIAVTGKGGVGKTTIAAAIAVAFSKEKKVIAADCDPDSNLAQTLNFPNAEKITPISGMKNIINERTEAKNGFFKMNPKVDDIPEKFCPEYKNIRLINMGSLKKGGSGCFCPENAFIKTLVGHLVLQRDEVLIMDMPAGIENLSRGTATGVDAVLIIVEPDIKSIETAKRIKKLCYDLKINKVFIVGNKVLNKTDEEFIGKNVDGIDPVRDTVSRCDISNRVDILSFIGYNKNLRDARGVLLCDSSILSQIEKIKIILEAEK